MRALDIYDKKFKENKCVICSHHVTRSGKSQDLHFCEISGKILLFPLYLPANCINFEERTD